VRDDAKMSLDGLGWDPFFEAHFAPFWGEGLMPARVAQEHRELYLTCGELGELPAKVSGKLRHGAGSKGEFPTVGDWVAIEPRPAEGAATIHALLPRRSAFSRKIAGATTEEHVVAANVDTALLVSGLDGDFNVRRIERYVTVAWDSGATPAIVLNKADICPEVEAWTKQVEEIALGVSVHPVSATEQQGLDALQQYLGRGRTVAMLGSSGVGKSSLINALLGAERLLTREVREDDSRGRHTTTWRELIFLPGGAMVIDTPGMRELQLWADEEALEGAFDDIAALGAQCRFRDCRHAGEPGCAIKGAIADGSLDADRYESYVRLQKELRHLARKQEHRARLAEKARWKKITVAGRQRAKERW
jgi:ribosome biogenesis GTPase